MPTPTAWTDEARRILSRKEEPAMPPKMSGEPSMTPPPEPRTSVDPAEIEEQRRRNWSDFHPEAYCHRCGRPNVWSWSAPSPLWNAVMEGDEGPWGIVCPPCFAELAEPIVGPTAHWRFAIEAEAAATPLREALDGHSLTAFAPATDQITIRCECRPDAMSEEAYWEHLRAALAATSAPAPLDEPPRTLAELDKLADALHARVVTREGLDTLQRLAYEAGFTARAAATEAGQ